MLEVSGASPRRWRTESLHQMMDRASLLEAEGQHRAGEEHTSCTTPVIKEQKPMLQQQPWQKLFDQDGDKPVDTEYLKHPNYSNLLQSGLFLTTCPAPRPTMVVRPLRPSEPALGLLKTTTGQSVAPPVFPTPGVIMHAGPGVTSRHSRASLETDFEDVVIPQVYSEESGDLVDTSCDEDEDKARDDAVSAREQLLMEPYSKTTMEEEVLLARLVRSHDHSYHSVNFGEQMIKEMIMCR